MKVFKVLKCKRCGKLWFSRKPGTPRICTTCKTMDWNEPKILLKEQKNDRQREVGGGFWPILLVRVPMESGWR
jgi:hypothetical protein